MSLYSTMCRKHIKKRDMAETRSNSSVFNVQAKVLKSHRIYT